MYCHFAINNYDQIVGQQCRATLRETIARLWASCNVVGRVETLWVEEATLWETIARLWGSCCVMGDRSSIPVLWLTIGPDCGGVATLWGATVALWGVATLWVIITTLQWVSRLLPDSG